MSAGGFHAVVADAAAIAAQHADEVDREARFPHEAIACLREGGALGAHVPAELGGQGVGFMELCDACRVLGEACAATAMVFAMHQIQVASVARHVGDSDHLRDYLRGLAGEGRLIASATSEVGTGGDLRRSVACVEDAGDGTFRFTKQAPTVSYGGHADDLLTTVRSGPDADASDQVLVLTPATRDGLCQTAEWDTLGMRGTCSPAFEVSATFGPEAIVPGPFAPICAETMVPYSHILWANVWLGIARAAAGRAQALVRAQARRTPGETPEAAHRLSHVVADYQALRAHVDGAAREYAELMDRDDRRELSSFGYGVRINTLKVRASDDTARVCLGALGVLGMAGYRNGTPYSVGRHLRDAMSAALMIGNERIHATNAHLLMVQREI